MMGFRVYDFRHDIANIFVTPQIRSRFLKMEIGQSSVSHTHDLGHEIFLILQGRAEFEINGHKQVLGPGQLCIAGADEPHTVRNVGDDDVIMYLSVTPHIQPTHTFWNEDGTKAPPRFAPATSYDQEPDRSTPTETLLDRHIAAAEKLAETTAAAIRVQQEQAAAFKRAITGGDKVAARQARDTMWQVLYTMYRGIYELGEVWNDFTARTADDEFLLSESP
jgi:quercetin dioxygenase-like cupin family protein